MDYITYTSKLDYIRSLSEKKATGTRKQLATKLRVSESTIKRMISRLRQQGFDIQYSNSRRSYILEL